MGRRLVGERACGRVGWVGGEVPALAGQAAAKYSLGPMLTVAPCYLPTGGSSVCRLQITLFVEIFPRSVYTEPWVTLLVVPGDRMSIRRFGPRDMLTVWKLLRLRCKSVERYRSAGRSNPVHIDAGGQPELPQWLPGEGITISYSGLDVPVGQYPRQCADVSRCCPGVREMMRPPFFIVARASSPYGGGDFNFARFPSASFVANMRPTQPPSRRSRGSLAFFVCGAY